MTFFPPLPPLPPLRPRSYLLPSQLFLVAPQQYFLFRPPVGAAGHIGSDILCKPGELLSGFETLFSDALESKNQEDRDRQEASQDNTYACFVASVSAVGFCAGAIPSFLVLRDRWHIVWAIPYNRCG